MLTLGRLLSYPMTFNHLSPKIKQVELEQLQDDISEGFHKISAIANGHQVELHILRDVVDASTPVKVFCDCPMFKFNIAYPLSKIDSLLHPEMFMLKPPKEKNTSGTLSGCKHLILVAQTIYQNRNLLKKVTHA